MTSIVEKHVTDLFWSLWTELGVPGVVREHKNVAIDPEPLLIVTPTAARSDARLMDQAVHWCRLHGSWLSAARMRAMWTQAEPLAAHAFKLFASSVPEHTQRWTGEASRSTTPVSKKTIELSLTRPALARLRLRALFGVGARADVVAELIAPSSRWLVASDFHHLGYTKRNVALILGELAQAGFARSLREKNALAYRLEDANQWRALVHARELFWPAWSTIFAFVIVALRLDAEREKREIVRRVAATKAAKVLTPLCDRLQLDRPPTTTGDTAAFELTLSFVEAHLAGFANGTSPALCGGATGEADPSAAATGRWQTRGASTTAHAKAVRGTR